MILVFIVLISILLIHIVIFGLIAAGRRTEDREGEPHLYISPGEASNGKG